MLSGEFLEKVAEESELSALQKSIFITKFSNAEHGDIKNDGEVLDELSKSHKISEKTVSNCMSEVYRKFGLKEPRPGKANLLLNLLLKKQPNEGSPSISLPLKTSDSVFPDDGTTRLLVKEARFLQVDDMSLKRVKLSLNEFSSVISKQRLIENEVQEKFQIEKREAEEKIRTSQASQTPKIEQSIIDSHVKNTLNQISKSEKKQIKDRLNKELSFKEKISIFTKDVKLPEQIIQSFFSSDPVERDDFINICSCLKIELLEIIDIDFAKTLVELVPEVRGKYYRKIKETCGIIKILDVEKPINLDDLYVDVNILSKLSRNSKTGIAELNRVSYNSKTEQFDRFSLGNIQENRVSGKDVTILHSKLMILGKPGSGKSTFLKHIAIQCNEDEFQPERIPVFIQLRAFAEDARKREDFDLINYIYRDLDKFSNLERTVLEKLLKHGRLLILLDGLDEVLERDSKEVLKQVEEVCTTCSRNQIIITCRIAAIESSFSSFTDVEIADFNFLQIQDFAKKWFVSVDSNSEKKGELKAKKFIQELESPENNQIKDICVTPILLILACLVFQNQYEFPKNRVDLYSKGLDILLHKWDKFKKITRNEIYKQLSIDEKKELLSYIAAITFKEGEIFFEEATVKKHIIDYLESRNKIENSLTELEQTEAILESIQVQHGLLVERASDIYSFSHLTFQEYFTAWKIYINDDSKIYEDLVSHITEPSWQEVLLFASQMLGRADKLLLARKKQIDSMFASDEKLQEFLTWLKEKTELDNFHVQPEVIRAFYFDLYLNFFCKHQTNPSLIGLFSPKLANISIDISSSRDLKSNYLLRLDYILLKALTCVQNISTHDTIDKSHVTTLTDALARALALEPELVLKKELQDLHDQLSAQTMSRKDWSNKLRKTIIKYRSIGKDWRLSKQQKELLKNYYDSNVRLIECLKKIEDKIFPEAKEQINNTLLLPLH